MCPQKYVEKFLGNINFIYNHYKMMNETFSENEWDQDITNMDLYEEKIRGLRGEG